MRDDRIKFDIPKSWLRRAVIAVAVGMLVLPAAAWAGHQFTDVPDSNIFHDDIDWMADTGVTKGCNPPDNTQYCPDDNVTREQMAAFLHRMDTEDVFVTPSEADLNSHFAVVAADGTEIAGDNLEGITHTPATGAYTLEFAADVSDCSWTGAIGSRGDTDVTTAHSILLNANDDPTMVDVTIVDDADVPVDADFNVTVTCNR